MTRRQLSRRFLLRVVGTAVVLASLSVVALRAGTAGNLTDAAVRDAVEDQLLLDRAVTGPLVDVTVANGIVTLEGRALSALAAERAVQRAEAVRGVRAVVDRLSVAAPAVPDADLERRIAQALLANPATESYEVRAEADAGQVTLRGTVESWAERDLAASVARGVTGVRAVDNQVAIAPQAMRRDEEIREDVAQALRFDIRIDAGLVDVRVQEGVVNLAGTVGSAAAKRRALALAQVAGVREVLADDLRVDPAARLKELRRSKYVVRPDDAVADALEAALARDPRVDASAVTVGVVGGIATLRGRVGNLQARRAAGSAAWHTVGVWRVDNRLRVRPAVPLSDAEVADRVRQALMRNPYVAGEDVSVAVRAGIVRLGGTVDGFFARLKAEQAASRTAGVVAVENNLTVRHGLGPLGFEPQVDEWVPPEYPRRAFATSSPGLDDATLRGLIEEQLFWSPLVDADGIQVAVEGGVATLSGRVDNWAERLAAAENALEGGAAQVVNRLVVRR